MHLTDAFSRMESGPLMTADDFVMRRLVPELKATVKEHQIRWDKSTFVNSDDDLADSVFSAACGLLAKVGIYCPDTNRVMEFDPDEIADSVRACRSSVELGAGTDRGVLSARVPDDTSSRPWVHVGGGMNVSDERVFLALVEGMASISEANSLAAPSLLTVDGAPARAGSPQEVLAAIRGVTLSLEGLQRAGRAGMPILNCISSVSASSSMFAASHPAFGLRTSDGYLVDFLSEMTCGFESLQRVAFYASLGQAIGSVAAPMYGGYAGGAEGVAVLATAYMIAGALLLKGRYHFNAPIHSRLIVVTAKPVIWASSLANQATSRNMPYPIFNTMYLAGGPGTLQSHLEAAAYLLAVVTSGANVYVGHPGSGSGIDSLLPGDHRLQARIGLGAARHTRSEANELVGLLYEQYADRLPTPDKGWQFAEVYDLDTHGVVNPEYAGVLDRAVEGLGEVGLEL